MNPAPPLASGDLLSPERIWAESLLAKVRGLIPWRTWESLDRCGKEEIYRTCKNCGATTTFFYRCSLKFCPLCNYRIARTRAEILREWVKTIQQPKHLVLTQRNFEVLTRAKIRQHRKHFAALRRQKFFAQVKGGCVSTEITNESRGWHLHSHILVDCRWIDIAEVSRCWGKLVGQEYAIVKIKDCRGKDYLGEVTKYVVKGSELAGWQPEEINQFVRAIHGIRFFSTFGTLFKLQAHIRALLNQRRPEATPCECGCSKWVFETETDSILHELRRRANTR